MAAGLIAIKAVLKFAADLRGSLVHESVVDEECSGSGAGTLACCLAGYRGEEAVVVDGEHLAVARGCQGTITADIDVQGRSGHAATGGVSAIDKALIVKGAIDAFKAQREAAHPDYLVNLGVFSAGMHPAVVPGRARMSLNIVYGVEEAATGERAGAGWNGAAIRREFENTVRGADDSDEWLREHRTAVEWVKDLVPYEVPADASVVRAVCGACRRVTGCDPAVTVMPAWVDAANLTRYAGIPTVSIGPATAGAPHSDNESVGVEDLVACAKTVAVYVCRRLCRARGGP